MRPRYARHYFAVVKLLGAHGTFITAGSSRYRRDAGEEPAVDAIVVGATGSAGGQRVTK
jgi:hypothetical protein